MERERKTRITVSVHRLPSRFCACVSARRVVQSRDQSAHSNMFSDGEMLRADAMERDALCETFYLQDAEKETPKEKKKTFLRYHVIKNERGYVLHTQSVNRSSCCSATGSSTGSSAGSSAGSSGTARLEKEHRLDCLIFCTVANFRNFLL